LCPPVLASPVVPSCLYANPAPVHCMV
jgi:hypothetical protein